MLLNAHSAPLGTPWTIRSLGGCRVPAPWVRQCCAGLRTAPTSAPWGNLQDISLLRGLVWCVGAENIRVLVLWREGSRNLRAWQKPVGGLGNQQKLCLGLAAGVSVHPLLTGVGDGLHVLNVYLIGSMAQWADAQPVEVKGWFSIVFSGLWIESWENNNIMVYLAVTMLAVLSDCRQ